MNYRIVFTEEATRKLQEIERYTLDNFASLKYIQHLLEGIKRLELFPRLGKRVNNRVLNFKDFYYLIVGNHIVYYLINDLAKCIYINTIFHQSSNWKNIVNREYISSSITINTTCSSSSSLQMKCASIRPSSPLDPERVSQAGGAHASQA